jgi:hypothetical protein
VPERYRERPGSYRRTGLLSFDRLNPQPIAAGCAAKNRTFADFAEGAVQATMAHVPSISIADRRHSHNVRAGPSRA